MTPELASVTVPILWQIVCAVILLLVSVLAYIGKNISSDLKVLNKSLSEMSTELRKEITQNKDELHHKLAQNKDELHDRITKTEMVLVQLQTTCKLEHGNSFGDSR